MIMYLYVLSFSLFLLVYILEFLVVSVIKVYVITLELMR